MTRLTRGLSIAFTLYVVSCSPTNENVRETEPIDASFQHLLERHDQDGDGAITKTEYARPSDGFARLDRDGDGRLTRKDFVAQGRRVRGISEARGVRLRAVHLSLQYLQDDDDPSRLDLAEMVHALAAYDEDGNGRIGRSEFEAAASSRRELGVLPGGRWAGLVEPETTDPWERLVLGIDQDRDSFLTEAELAAFYRAKPGDWDVGEAAEWPRESSLTGRTAPDFTLPRLEEDGTVTLSEVARERPVALIFGSYT